MNLLQFVLKQECSEIHDYCMLYRVDCHFCLCIGDKICQVLGIQKKFRL